ncbi:MAG TPA: hypothetical protein VEA15_01810 [Caulobacteraceae bacterium]|nr:hypothetical protein [Caulobacteraceae bacterium]
MNAEERLKAAFALDEPPARDLGFSAAVMERVARRRLQRSLLLLVPPLLAACAVLWALGPLLLPLAEGLGQGLAPAAGIVVMVAALTTFSLRALAPRRAR